MGIEPAWTPTQQLNNVNVSILFKLFLTLHLITFLQQLARDILHEALSIKRSYESFARPGVGNKRLEEFCKDPVNAGPKVKNTWLDKNADTAAEMLSLPWNQELIRTLAMVAESIVRESADKNRFGPALHWVDLFSDRVHRMCVTEMKARPVESETEGQALARIWADHNLKTEEKKGVNARHHASIHLTLYHVNTEVVAEI
ncbi:hypothetical protein BT96DRAFT_844343 [Gymnopus androsaceus JB14]|uniref:Uncharacterized protein n=1 Tax=Gymnopus androsaceus JB14 TaxID=1447944 RepID=A0A6A4GCK5_9AGAR|nr:hypothetical protein BT96DRAFT_844343 [Gymnopus androsaceus JB14]